MRALLEVLHARLGIKEIKYEKQSTEEMSQVKFFVTDQQFSKDLKIISQEIRGRRDMMLYLRGRAKQILNSKPASESTA